MDEGAFGGSCRELGPASPLEHGQASLPNSPCKLPGSPFKLHSLPSSPPKQTGSRRASLATADERRLSAVRLPESHPVSPDRGSSDDAGCGNDAGTSPASQPKARASSTSPPAHSHFSIPAYRGAVAAAAGGTSPLLSSAPLPVGTSVTAVVPPAPAEPRVTLNLFVDSAGEEEVGRLLAELAGMRSCVGMLQQQLGDALQRATRMEQQLQKQAAAATEAAATVAAEQEPSGGVALVINVVEQPATADSGSGAATPPPQQQEQQDLQQAAAAEQSVQLILNIVELAEPSAAEISAAPPDTASPVTATTGAGDLAPAALQQQLQRAEACREELARQAGQLKGRIAKLEGAVLAGEGRVRAQAAELEAYKSHEGELERELAAAQAQVGVTPERSRVDRQRLAAEAAAAQAAAEAAVVQVQRLEAVLSFEARERQELSHFTCLEHQVLAEEESRLAAEAAQCRADAAAAAAQLGEARQRLVDADAALMQRDEEVKQLRSELEAAQAAAGAAAELTAEWRQRADQFDRDRQAAAANIRKAEKELELVAADNERMFRQLNFVRTRLMGQLTNLDGSVPDIGKLARELQSWCDRETAQRARHKA